MSKEDSIPAEGTIIDKLPNTIRILIGDRASIEMSPYDLSRGRITYRHR